MKLEPFGPDHCCHQVDEYQGCYDRCQNDHRRLLNLFARDQERETKSETDEPQQEARGQPDCQIHRFILPFRKR